MRHKQCKKIYIEYFKCFCLTRTNKEKIFAWAKFISKPWNIMYYKNFLWLPGSLHLPGASLFVKWMMTSYRFRLFMCWIIFYFSVFTDYKGHICPFLQNPICCHWPSLRWMEIFSSADLAFATYQLITLSFSKLSAPAECKLCAGCLPKCLCCVPGTLRHANWAEFAPEIFPRPAYVARTRGTCSCMCNSQSDAHFWMSHMQTSSVWPQYA